MIEENKGMVTKTEESEKIFAWTSRSFAWTSRQEDLWVLSNQNWSELMFYFN